MRVGGIRSWICLAKGAGSVGTVTFGICTSGPRGISPNHSPTFALAVARSTSPASTSTCYDDCAAAWPPLLTEGMPAADGQVDASKLSTTERQGGPTQGSAERRVGKRCVSTVSSRWSPDHVKKKD